MEKTREQLVKEMADKGDLYIMNEIATPGAPDIKVQEKKPEEKK